MEKIYLGKTDLQVSMICLGAMRFGARDSKDLSFQMLDTYLDQGGNFIDTANIYAHWYEGAVGGDLVPCGPGNSPSKNGTRVYLNCDGKLDAVLSRVERAGGKTVQPKTSIGKWGWIAFIEDTEGNVVGLHSYT